MEIYTKKKLAFIGGDMRSSFAAQRLREGDYEVATWGLPIETELQICNCEDIYEALRGADAVILSIPSTLDGVSLNCRCEEEIALGSIVRAMKRGAILIGGRLPEELARFCGNCGIEAFDLLKNESFLQSNAYITAEAAVFIAMSNLKKNIRDSSFAITGYGRISKELAGLLSALGASVTVAARKESDIAIAKSLGYGTLRLNVEPIYRLCEGYDVIFNTVPQCIFDESFMEKLDRKTLFVELASAPGGVEVAIAKKLRSKVLWASSLPGKYAPQSAGELISDFTKGLFEEAR